MDRRPVEEEIWTEFVAAPQSDEHSWRDMFSYDDHISRTINPLRPSKPTATILPHRFTLNFPPPTPLPQTQTLNTQVVRQPPHKMQPPLKMVPKSIPATALGNEGRKEGMLHQHLLMRMMSTDELSMKDERLMQYVCGI